MPEVKRSPPALCVRQETQCRADKKCSYIVNLWGGPLPGLMGPKTSHGSPPERNPGYAPGVENAVPASAENEL